MKGICNIDDDDVNVKVNNNNNRLGLSITDSDSDSDSDSDVLTQPPTSLDGNQNTTEGPPRNEAEGGRTADAPPDDGDEDEDEDRISMEVMLSSLARREVEHRTSERRALQAEKKRTRQFRRRGLAIDQNGSLEHTLSLVEMIPNSMRRLSHNCLPGGRGTEAPEENLLSLANEMSGEGVEPFEKIHNACLLEEYALQLLAPQLKRGAASRKRIEKPHQALSLPAKRLCASTHAQDDGQENESEVGRERERPYFVARERRKSKTRSKRRRRHGSRGVDSGGTGDDDRDDGHISSASVCAGYTFDSGSEYSSSSSQGGGDDANVKGNGNG